MRHIKFSSIGKRLNPLKLFKTKRTIKYIVIHCSANSHGSPLGARAIDNMHRRRWGAKSGCGYHYVVLHNGELQKGRWVDFPGAHVKGYNSNSIGICYIGGLDAAGIAIDDLLSTPQRITLVSTIKTLKTLYPDAVVIGHKEFPNVNKACPCLDMSRLKLEVEGRLF